MNNNFNIIHFSITVIWRRWSPAELSPLDPLDNVYEFHILCNKVIIIVSA